MTQDGLTPVDRGPAPDPHVREQPGPVLRIIGDQRLAFAVVGGFNTLVSFVAFALFSRLTDLWGGDLAVLDAQLVTIPVAFALHRRFVFRVTGHVLRDFGRFVLVNLIPITVNLAVLPVLTTVFGWPVLLSQVGFTLAWVASSYFLHRGFSFRRSAQERSAEG